ncbi:glycosyl transferase family protein [Sporocytophaga myxococcoides]|uniref:Glycosyl transferase family protein n=2 Tax=Sporocytophaga myxococcoides TaxID=153721 RepID=A0A098LI75_9BACT|nr:glycosyl transferase family protein [Sporocytophaga myxococcoides]
MTTYNQEQYIAKALDSILSQKHDYNYEIVVSDDCSTDNTRQIIKDYQKEYPHIIRPILNNKNLGVSKNCIQNFRSCRGEYIATLDGDDYWTDQDKIKKQITFLDENPQYVISCHRYKRFYTETQKYEDDLHPELFIDKPDGFEFGQEYYFEKWLTQTLTMVFRNSAMEDTPHFETNRYCWDTQIFWTLLNKGKGYVHNFFGGVYLIHSKGVWSKHIDQQKYSLNYLSIEELYRDFHDNIHLKRIYNLYKKNLPWIKSEFRRPLNPEILSNKHFTIVSDDNWGEELYKAFNLPRLTPFIGTHIYNKDFVKLTDKFSYYINQKIKFIDLSESNNIKEFRHTYGTQYPIGKLDDIEIHFTKFRSEQDALNSWEDGKNNIVWDNIYFKMDASHEGENIDEINNFQKTQVKNKVCFLNHHDKNKLKELVNKDNLIIMDFWNPQSDIFFPYSISTFDVITWLNTGKAYYYQSKYDVNNIFSPVRKRFFHFTEFDGNNAGLLDADLYANAYQIRTNNDTEVIKISYDKQDEEYFRLSLQEPEHPLNIDLYVDLSEKENRHILILMNGDKEASLTMDIIARDENENDFSIKSLTKANIEQEYQWLHFDFTSLPHDQNFNFLLSRIKSFSFYINEREKAKGEVNILAFFAGSMDKFQELID